MTELWPALGSSPKSNPKPKPKDDPLDFSELAMQTTSYICPTCDDDAAIETSGNDVVCLRCGTIVDIPLEWAAEYRWFSSDVASGGGPDPSRCSFPINHLMPESSLGTMILTKNQNPLMRRIKRYHMWNLMPYRERTLWSVFDSLQTRIANAGMSTAVLEETKELYAQLTASAICRGQAQRDAMLAACLSEALKRHDAPRMPKDVADIFNIPVRNVTKGIKQFQQLLAIRTSGGQTDTYAVPRTKEIKVIVTETDETMTARANQRRAIWQSTVSRTTSYEDFIKPFIANMCVSNKASVLEEMVRAVCIRTEELGVVPENTPPSLTASVIAFCCTELGITIDIAELAKVCGISAVTIQKCLKRMGPWKVQLTS